MEFQKIINNKFFWIFILFFVFLSYSFYSSLYHVLDNRDEIRYLSDRLLLLEGLRPSFSHAPQGISLWIGMFTLLIEFLLGFLINFDFSELNLINIFNYFDYKIYENYLDLTHIKLINFILVLSALAYLYFQDKTFFYIFSLIFFSFIFYYISFAGKPYLLASIFFSISLIMKKRNRRNLSLLFFSLACAERLEFLVFINYFCIEGFDRKSVKNYAFVILVFMALSPWFTQAITQHIKALSGYLFAFDSNSSDVVDNENNNIFLKILKIISFFSIIFFTLCLNSKLSERIEKVFISLIFVFLVIAMILNSNIPFRWFLPHVVFIIYYVFLRYNINNKLLIIIIIFNFINLALFQIQLKKIPSDKYILNLENKTNTNIISLDLLIEDSNFKNYRKWQIKNIESPNVKNINYFKKNNAPLIFGRSGNYEYAFSRRTEYLSKYHKKQGKNKFIYGYGGLFLNYSEWCSILNNNASYLINQNFDFIENRKTSINNCKK